MENNLDFGFFSYWPIFYKKLDIDKIEEQITRLVIASGVEPHRAHMFVWICVMLISGNKNYKLCLSDDSIAEAVAYWNKQLSRETQKHFAHITVSPDSLAGLQALGRGVSNGLIPGLSFDFLEQTLTIEVAFAEHRLSSAPRKQLVYPLEYAESMPLPSFI